MSMSTMRFGQNAKKIKNKIVPNIKVPNQKMIGGNDTLKNSKNIPLNNK